MKYLAREGTEGTHSNQELDYCGAPHVRPSRDGVARIRP